MRKWLWFWVYLFLTSAAFAAQTITVDGKNYNLAHVANNEVLLLNEYVISGSTLENYDTLIGLHVYHNQRVDKTTFAMNLGKLVKQMNPQANYRIIKNDKTGEVLLDFLTWDTKKGGLSEFNIFKFKDGTRPNEIIALQYVWRVNISKDLSKEAAAKQFSDERHRMIDIIGKQPYPDVQYSKE